MTRVHPALGHHALLRAAEQDRRIAGLEAALRRAADALQRAEFFEEAKAARAVIAAKGASDAGA
jgi:hypothetical protein